MGEHDMYYYHRCTALHILPLRPWLRRFREHFIFHISEKRNMTGSFFSSLSLSYVLEMAMLLAGHASVSCMFVHNKICGLEAKNCGRAPRPVHASERTVLSYNIYACICRAISTKKKISSAQTCSNCCRYERSVHISKTL